MSRTAADRQLLALRPAFAAAMACVRDGRGDEDWLSAARPLLGPLIAGNRHSAAKRGPKEKYNREWTLAQLALQAESVNGLPADQGAIVGWLEYRFEAAGREVPKETWLRNRIREFRAGSLIQERDRRQKYTSDSVLRERFETVEEYIGCEDLQSRWAEKWLHDSGLQERYGKPGDFVSAMFKRQAERAATGESSVSSSDELVNNSDKQIASPVSGSLHDQRSETCSTAKSA